ncbi:hypothetical protein HK104_011353 [Borealophlyctis nickersoniae]|nr:hypothetical protein HK104_011353 [Borealophlyctis nickersoniae]
MTNTNDEQDDSKVSFLIAGYARYGQPFVWLRSDQRKLVKQQHEQMEPDMPLKLVSTNNWASQGSRLIDIISEILSLVLLPAPFNPFAVNHALFSSLPVEESLVCTAAMLDFLSGIFLLDPVYSDHVLEDIKLLQQRQFKELAIAAVP